MPYYVALTAHSRFFRTDPVDLADIVQELKNVSQAHPDMWGHTKAGLSTNDDSSALLLPELQCLTLAWTDLASLNQLSGDLQRTWSEGPGVENDEGIEKIALRDDVPATARLVCATLVAADGPRHLQVVACRSWVADERLPEPWESPEFANTSREVSLMTIATIGTEPARPIEESSDDSSAEPGGDPADDPEDQ